MKVAVIGKNSQIASELKVLKNKDKDWVFLDKTELDISNDLLVENYFSERKFDIIINCAAYTNVNDAEKHPNIAYEINQLGVKNLIFVCEKFGIKLIHFSTDYVFDGTKSSPYKESDTPNPISVYGKSKLAGENELKYSKVLSIIIRTSWLHSKYGENFLKKIIKIAKTNNEVKLIDDQIGSPTNAVDLAKLVLHITNFNDYEWKIADVFHFSNEGSCSWFEFAKEIVKLYNINIVLKRISSVDYNSKLIRPKYSVLDKRKIKKTFFFNVINWKSSLYKSRNLELLKI